MHHHPLTPLVCAILLGSVALPAAAQYSAIAACRPSDTECLRQQGQSVPDYDTSEQPCVGPPSACGDGYGSQPPPEVRRKPTGQLHRELGQSYEEWKSRNEQINPPVSDPYGRRWYQEHRARRDEMERRRQSTPFGPLDRGYGDYPPPDPYPPVYNGYRDPYPLPPPPPPVYYPDEPYYPAQPDYGPEPYYPQPYPGPYYPR